MEQCIWHPIKNSCLCDLFYSILKPWHHIESRSLSVSESTENESYVLTTATCPVLVVQPHLSDKLQYHLILFNINAPEYSCILILKLID